MARSASPRPAWSGPGHEARRRERQQGHTSLDASEEERKPARADRSSAESWVGLALSPFFQIFPGAELEDLPAGSRIRVPALQALVQARRLPKILDGARRLSGSHDLHVISLSAAGPAVNVSPSYFDGFRFVGGGCAFPCQTTP